MLILRLLTRVIISLANFGIDLVFQQLVILAAYIAFIRQILIGFIQIGILTSLIGCKVSIANLPGKTCFRLISRGLRRADFGVLLLVIVGRRVAATVPVAVPVAVPVVAVAIAVLAAIAQAILAEDSVNISTLRSTLDKALDLLLHFSWRHIR